VNFLAFILLAILVTLPYFIIKGFKKASISEQEIKKHEELKELENSLSHLLAELQETSEKSLKDAETAISRLDLALKKAEEKIEKLDSSQTEEKTNECKIKTAVINKTVKQIRTPKHLKVHHLANQGLSINEIAQRLEAGIGEVELILNLNDAKKAELM